MEVAPKRPSPLWFWGPNSKIVVYMDPLGYKPHKLLKDPLKLYKPLVLNPINHIKTQKAL